METTQELRAFENSEFGKLEVTLIDGKVYFPATKCAEVLGYEKPHDAISRHCRYSVKHGVGVQTGTKADGAPAIQTVQMSFIPEGDLYRLIIRSNLPVAERFERWVFDEVLPEIRKIGGYMVDRPNETEEELLARSHEVALRVLARREEQIRKLESTVGTQSQQIAEMEPKASYYDVILKCEDAVAVSVIAKDYGKSGRWLNRYLHDAGVQFKQGDIWLLYAKHAEKGYTCTKTHNYLGHDGAAHASLHTYWTQEERRFLYDLLKKDGVLPLIEQERPAA
jgi:prophage antirepressor-like protein